MAFVHASLFICTFGLLSNTCMTVLLTRSRLATTINRLLAMVTLSDALLMCSTFVYICHFDLLDLKACPVDMLTYGWVLFQLVHSNWSVYLRAVSLWLSVVIAGYRKHVLSKTKPRHHRKAGSALKLGSAVAFLVFLICIPIFLQNRIIEGPLAPENNTVCPKNHSPYYTLRPPAYALQHGGLLLKMAYWTNGLLLKLLPCGLLAYYLMRVVHLMYSRHQHRRHLFQQTHGSQSDSGQNGRSHGSPKCHTMMPTTLMLVVILCTTVLCELPNAVLSLMRGTGADSYHRKTYVGEILDLLSLFSCTSTSILYFVMSRSLRKSFADVFCAYFRTFKNGECHQGPNVARAEVKGDAQMICLKTSAISSYE